MTKLQELSVQITQIMTKKQELSNIELLLELEERLKTEAIYFQIDKQDCYLIENNFHVSNKIKVGDLSLTKEYYWNKWFSLAKEFAKKNAKRKALLDSKFKEINDVELIEEVQKRADNKNFNFTTYERENDILVDIEAKSMKVNIISPLFTIKKDKNHD